MDNLNSHRANSHALAIQEVDYCPPLDPGLFRSIISDYDLSEPSNRESARMVLDGLKASAEVEQATEFDPSGVGKPGDTSGSSGAGDLISLNDDSGVTSITESVTSLGFQAQDISGSSNIPETYDEGIEELSVAEKQDLLSELCPESKAFDIQFVLKKNQNSFLKSLDEILNQTWISENSGTLRGVDGFFQTIPRTTKRKGKRKARRLFTSEPADFDDHADVPVPDANKWEAKTAEIEYIASRTCLPRSLVSSIYHQSGGSVRMTIFNLCKVSTTSFVEVSTEDPRVRANATQLAKEFPLLSSEESVALILMTHPSTANAHELAKAMISRSTTSVERPLSSYVLPQYARLVLQSNSGTKVRGGSTSAPDLLTPLHELNHATLSAAAAKQARVRELRFEQATAAWRKSRSNPLMGGAAAYYAEERRKADAASRAYETLAADAYVQSNSSSDLVDLHGVSVQDAVRIAKREIQSWWNSDVSEWAREGRARGGNGFTIVTGAGTHSAGGRARIRPAVLKALREDGWRAHEGRDSGEVVIVGRARK